MQKLQWLILPDERTTRYTNVGDGSPSDASGLIAKVNADPSINQGHNDWRLPTIDELKALIGSKQDPGEGWYWSSSPFVGDPCCGWYAFFGYGCVCYDYLNDDGHVRLVRADQ